MNYKYYYKISTIVFTILLLLIETTFAPNGISKDLKI